MDEKQKTINRQLFNAFEVTPSKIFWTVLVQVVEKHRIRESRGNKGITYMNYVLTDMQGTKIPTVSFSQNIMHVAKLLHPYKCYYISNAGVQDADLSYRLGPYCYKWILSSRTLIEPVHDDVPYTLPCNFELTNFSSLTKLVDKDVIVAIKALVIHSYAVHNPSNNTTRDYIVIDQEKKAMILRLWDDYLDNEEIHVSSKLPEPTLIVGRSFKVTTHHGISMTTKNYPYFMIEPPLAEHEPLMQWYKEHAEEVVKLVEEKSYLDTTKLLPPPDITEIVALRDVVASIEQLKTAWVSGTVQLVPAQKSLWYSVCHSCKKALNAQVDWKITCTSCGEHTLVEPRSRIEVYLSDATTTICATVFGLNAEKLTNITAKDMQAADEKGSPLFNDVEKNIYKQEVICFLKYFERSFGGKNEKSFPILQLYNKAELNALYTTRGCPSPLPEGPTGMHDIGTFQNKKDHQLFSPTTKKVIEEISSSPTCAEPHRGLALGPKRSLTFGTFTTQLPGLDVNNPAEIIFPDCSDVALSESPVKKIKDKAQIKEKQS